MAIEALSNIVRGGVGAFSAGGGAAPTTVTLNITPAQQFQAVVSAVNPSATPSASALCSLVPTSDWDADELDGFAVFATCGAGVVDFCLTAPGPIGGQFKVVYTLG